MSKTKKDIKFGNEPNRNDRIYSPEVVKEIEKAISQQKIPITNPVTEITEKEVDSKDIVGWVEDSTYYENENRLEINCDIFSKRAWFLVNNGFKIVPNGFGNLDPETKEVKNYSLKHFSLTDDSAFDIENEED